MVKRSTMSKETGYKEMIGGCCVCSDESGSFDNPLVYCDGSNCSVAVHKACYGIVEVPKGPWFCRKCESQERVARVKCELCPQRAGALKRTDAGGWCHVVCALYIPEAWFANVQTMEPIVLSGVPQERFNKVCYICEEQNKDTKATAGACMQCMRASCKYYFHVTCAQAQGLLCEVTSNYQNINYCGYCAHHYKKSKNNSNVKTIPAFRPVHTDTSTPESSPEKNPPNILFDPTKGERPVCIPEVKSPQIDQSVSSTSDALPPALTRSDKGPQARSLSRSYSEVSDVSSVLSPGEDLKPADQEPSSSMATSEAPILQPASPPAPICRQMSEIDVGENQVKPVDDKMNLEPPELRTAEPRESGSRRKSKESSKKSSSKKSSRNIISSTVSGAAKESKKSSSKRRRDEEVVKTDPAETVELAANFSGHCDFPTPDLSTAVFGGSPFFQSLSAPGHVTLPAFTSQDTSSGQSSGQSQILPPKYFPSQMSATKPDQDRSQDFPLTMEHFLEQQWDHGAHFLMEQGQTFDIASFLKTLYRINSENKSLEDQVKELTARRDHLRAVNARLSLPLSLQDVGTNSKTSSVGSLEDISSPDETAQPSLDKSTPPTVQIPNSNMIVEDILSPAEKICNNMSNMANPFSTK